MKITDCKKLADEYDDLIESIHSSMEAQLDLANEIRNTYRDMANDIADAEGEISNIIKDAWQQRVDATTEALDKMQKAKQDQWDEEDFQDEKAGLEKELLDIQKQINNAKASNDNLKLAQLMKDKEDKQKEIDELIKEKERDNFNNKVSDEKDTLQEQMKQATTEDALDNAITNALKNGYIKVQDQVISLQSATIDYLKESTEGQESYNIALDEMVNSLETANSLMKEMSSINNGAGFLTGFSALKSANISNSIMSSLPNSTSNLSTNNTTNTTNNNSSYNITIQANDSDDIKKALLELGIAKI